MSDMSRAFQLCQNGAEAELASMLQSRTIDAAACQTTGMYSGWSLLHAAASKGHMRIVQMLLDEGAPASACNPKSKTPAQVAHEKGHSAVAALLQQAEASPGAALGAAAAVGKAFNLCLSGNDAELSKMLNEGAIAASACQTSGMYAGWSLLHAAAMKGHERIVKVLLAFGASAMLTTPKGKTAAQLANDKGHGTLAALLRGIEPATIASPSPPASELTEPAVPEPAVVWIPSGQFGDRRCRDGGACHNAQCGFAHPSDWVHFQIRVHFEGEYPGCVTSPGLDGSGSSAEDAWQAEQMAWPMGLGLGAADDGELDEEETRLHASAHHGALTSPQVSSMRRSTRGTRRTVWHCMRALQQTPSLWSPEEQPLSPLHVKPWSAHRHSRRGGCTPNRRVYRGECSLSQASLIAAQSSVSKSRGESLRRLFEHHRLALCCIYPASSITQDRHPWCLSS